MDNAIIDIKQATKLALEYLQAGNVQEAEYFFREILKAQPNNVSALHFIGIIYFQRKNYALSIEHITKAIQAAPDYADAYNNLGIVFQEIGRLDEAITCYRKVLELNPNFAKGYCNLGSAMKEKWQLDEAIMHFQKAFRLDPDFAEAYHNLGNALQEQGKLQEAEECYRHALKLKPDCPPYYDNLLFVMNYNSRHNAQAIFSEHLRYAKHIAESLSSPVMPHKNDCSSVRRLGIGYVSPDFKRHSVAYFIEPVIAAHDKEHFDIFCYSDVPMEDEVTERIRGYAASHWRTIAGMSDAQVAQLIREDAIDILIDLAGHTAHNRLLVFARKPVPLQVSWIGYPATTGLSTMDYKIVDGYTDPLGMTERFYTEDLIRMPESFLCYLPEKDSPGVSPLPALSSGHLTFGSFSYFPKISPDTVTMWTTILKTIHESRLILKTRNFSDKTTRQYAMDMFIRQGVAADRIELMPINASFREHLEVYNRVDIALDTFPYNGTTTTCESLWMGVPVVTLAGNTHASRVGMSLLSNIGLPDLVARTGDEYVSIVVNLANDRFKLKLLRENLRQRVMRSVLLDAKRFTGNLESRYRQIWERWCQKRQET